MLFGRFIVTEKQFRRSERKGNNPAQRFDYIKDRVSRDLCLREVAAYSALAHTLNSHKQAKMFLEESFLIDPSEGDNQFGKHQLCSVTHHVRTGGKGSDNVARSGHYTTCALKKLKPFDQEGDDINAETNATYNNEQQWMHLNDRLGVKTDLDFVTGDDENQQNCYYALYKQTEPEVDVDRLVNDFGKEPTVNSDTDVDRLANESGGEGHMKCVCGKIHDHSEAFPLACSMGTCPTKLYHVIETCVGFKEGDGERKESFQCWTCLEKSEV